MEIEPKAYNVFSPKSWQQGSFCGRSFREQVHYRTECDPRMKRYSLFICRMSSITGQQLRNKLNVQFKNYLEVSYNPSLEIQGRAPDKSGNGTDFIYGR